MTSYAEAVAYLYGLQTFGIKLGLDNIRTLLSDYGNPHRAYPVIHVAGTNGKGSTSAYIASILSSARYRTGLYTSPHLVDFRERIRVDGVPIPEADVLRMTIEMAPRIDELKATFFEATTAMAFRYFAERRAGAAVIETGLGGRLDSTNIVEPALSVITGIAFDHTEYLGTTLAAIAAEKAGIIKNGVPVVSADLQPEAMDVVAEVARERGAALHVVPTAAGIEQIIDIDHMEFDAAVLRSIERFVSPLVGDHQAANARLAIRAAELLAVAGWRVGTPVIIQGIGDVKRRTGIAGRLDRIAATPECVVDVAHNPDGVAALLCAWRAVRETARTHLVFGLLRTKNSAEVLALLAAHRWASVTIVNIPHPDGRPASEIAAAAQGLEPAPRVATDAVAAVVDHVHSARSDESILVFGSHYLVGAILASGKKSGSDGERS